MIVLGGAISAFAQDNNDKAKHFAISTAFGGISESVFHYGTHMKPVPRIAAGTLVGCIPGLIKEIHDSHQANNKFSGADMAADVAGAFTGSVLANFINSRIKVQFSGNKVALAYHF